MKRLLVILALLTALMGHPMATEAEDDAALRPWIETYVFAYPLVFMDVTRLYTQAMTGAKDNEFFRGSVFAEAAANGSGGNLLVSAAWLDLSKGPVIVHLPDFGGRYHLAELTDGWSNKFAALRTGTANKDGRDLAVVGPRWVGTLPYGVTKVPSPTNMALLTVHVLSRGTVEDIAAVYALQDRLSLTLPGSGGRPRVATPVPPGTLPTKPPSRHIADMDAKTFFTHFAALLASSPPAPADAAMAAKLASMGIVPAPGFDFDAFDPAIRDEISRSVATAGIRVEAASLPRAVSDVRLDPDPAAYYQYRAHRALVDLATNVPAGQADRRESEESVSVENEIVFKPEGRTAFEADFDIREDIERGQEFLKDKTAGYTQIVERKTVTFFDRKGRRKEKFVTTKIIHPNFLLAVEDLKERKIRQVRITDRGCVTEGFKVTVVRKNGVGSRFDVAYPENMAILALRTTVRAENKGLKEVVYTPYSPEIDTPEVRKAGLDYLTERIRLAKRDLAAKKIRLANFHESGEGSVDVSLVLSIIEHIDPVRFERQKGNEIALVREVLTIVGANTTMAYNYSRSSAGARGLFQLIPDTYRRLQEKYRSAGLKSDFVSGVNDHTNAAKASLLLFDSDLASMPKKLLSGAGKDARAIGMYLAAAYNCGAGRAEKSARECKGQWTCLLPEETRIYLKKFEAVWNLRNSLDR